jgi:L-threonylcarbamoyladenylate synthase
VLQVDPERPDPSAIEEAARAIQEGKLVAFPTETVYGLGANALDRGAVARIFEAKDRPTNDPLIVHLAHIGQLSQVASRVPPGARKLALAFWAGPLTLILPKTPAIDDVVTAGLPNVAVRVPAHRVARALMEMAGVPIAAPSANRFSRPSPTTAAHVLADLDGRIDLVLDGGPATIGLESSIVDFAVEPPVLRRPGGLSIEQIRAHVPELQVMEGYGTVDEVQLAPGQLLRHYSPKAPLTLYEGEPAAVAARIAADARRLVASGERVGILAPEEDIRELAPVLAAAAAGGRVVSKAYGSRRDPERAARELYDALRSLETDEVTVILATVTTTKGVGFAIRDRLFRAAAGRLSKA